MATRTRAAGAAACSLLALAGAASAVELFPQQTSNWCWAASAQMAMVALGRSSAEVAQVVQAGHRFPPETKCRAVSACEDGGYVSRRCNLAGFPEFTAYGFDVDETATAAPLSWDVLACELAAGRPVAYALEDRTDNGTAGTGHMWLATAVNPTGKQLISVNDPGPVCKGNDTQVMPYEQYAGREDRAHWVTYYHLRLRGQPVADCPVAPAPAVPWKAPEGSTAAEVVPPFLGLVTHDAWVRQEAGLVGDGNLSCDLANPIPLEVIAIATLRDVPPNSRLRQIARDARKTRYLCTNELGPNQSDLFSAEAAEATSGKWQVASIGSINLAADIRTALDTAPTHTSVREVYVQGLNVQFLRFERAGQDDWIVPLSVNRDLGINPQPQTEAPLVLLLRQAATGFVASGPS